MYTRLNGNRYNYFNPTGYYGLNYSPKSKMSFSWNGFYVHTLFDASYKNSVSIPTSFFEVTKGNPDLKPTKVFSNTFEYNYHWRKTSLTASYMCYIYFDNILHIYEADDSSIYTNLSNGGNFYGNMLTPCFNMSIKDYDNKSGRSLAIKVTYNFGYGKKVKRSNNTVEKYTNSAIMKPY